MNMRRIITFTFVWVAITALAIGLSGCERITSIVSDSETTMPEMMDGEIPIGVIVALTGDNTIYGIPMKNGFELASEEINANSDMNITLIIEDDQSSVSGSKECCPESGGSRRAGFGWKCYLNAVQSGVSDCPREWSRGVQFGFLCCRFEQPWRLSLPCSTRSRYTGSRGCESDASAARV